MRLRKRSIVLAGHATSVALEPAFWTVLERMAAERNASLAALMLEFDQRRGEAPLASAARVAALEWAVAGAEGQVRGAGTAGDGNGAGSGIAGA
jgi:predicted DNA-binding ribbon-helix-helix protein